MQQLFNKCLYLVLILIVFISCSDKKNVSEVDDNKIDLVSGDWYGKAIAYSGYREGQDPRKEVFPSKEEVLEDLKILERNWQVIRTYGADQHTSDILEVIKKESIKLKVLLGIWLDGEPEYIQDNENQVKYGIELANKYKDIVIAVNVGNECQVHWSDHKVPNEKLISYIKEVQGKVNLPVTTADSWDYWLDLENSKNLIDAVDFVAVHIYPIWGKVDIDRGMKVTEETFDSLTTEIPNKKIIITEAGWATYTEGELHVPKAGDENKQEIYYNQLMEWAEKNKVIVFWFEAFDESWKGKGTEGYWGLFTEERKVKKAMKKYYPELIIDEPTSPSYK